MLARLKTWLGLNYYTSEIDQFLDKVGGIRHQVSASQRAEIDKYQQVFQGRDNPQAAKNRPTGRDILD